MRQDATNRDGHMASCKHRTPTELFVQIEAFFDDCNKELTIEFAQDWEAVTIEIKSKEGYVVYRNLYIPHSNSSLSTSFREYSGRNI